MIIQKLSLEATAINQNFSQQILKENDGTSRKTFEPNPFWTEEEDGAVGSEPAAVAYRYRKFTLGNIKVIARYVYFKSHSFSLLPYSFFSPVLYTNIHIYSFLFFYYDWSFLLVNRCELHGWAAKGKESPLFTAYALNEWDSRFAGGLDWRRKIDQQVLLSSLPPLSLSNLSLSLSLSVVPS